MENTEDLNNSLRDLISTYGSGLENQIKGINRLTAQLGTSGKGFDKLKGQLDTLRETVTEGADAQERLLKLSKKAAEEAAKHATTTKKHQQLTEKATKLQAEYVRVSENVVSANRALLASTAELQKSQVSAALGSGAIIATMKVAAGFVKDTSTLAQTAITGLQTSVDGIGTATSVYIDEIKRTANAAKAAGDVLSETGKTLSLVPGWGTGLEVAGAATKMATDAIYELNKDGIDVLKTELVKTTTTFKTATGAGAFLSNGLTGLRDDAQKSGLRLTEYASVLDKASDNLRLFGTTQAEAMRQVGGVVSSMAPEVSQQLRKLGYSQEEMAEGTAEYMATLALAGGLAGKGQGDLARESAGYLTNLKLISAVTGEDAKAAQKRARDASQQSAVFSMLSTMGGAATAKFQELVKVMPGMEKEIQQMLLTGSTTNAALVNSPIFGIIQNAIVKIRDTSVKADGDITKSTIVRMHETADAQAAALKSGAAAGQGAVMGINSEYAEQQQKLVTTLNQSRQDVGKTLAEQAAQQKDASKGGDKMLDSVTKLNAQYDKAANVLETRLTKGLTGFADQLESTLKDVDKWVQAKLNLMVSESGAGPTIAGAATAASGLETKLSETVSSQASKIWESLTGGPTTLGKRKAQLGVLEKKLPSISSDSYKKSTENQILKLKEEIASLEQEEKKKVAVPDKTPAVKEPPSTLSVISKTFTDMFGGTAKTSEREVVAKPVDKKVESTTVPQAKPVQESKIADNHPKAETVTANPVKEKQSIQPVNVAGDNNPTAKIILPKELAGTQHAVDIKAAKEYAVAQAPEKAAIREVTGLTDTQLTTILAESNKAVASTIKAVVPATERPTAETAQPQMGIPKSLKDLNINATIPDGKAIPVNIQDNKVFSDILDAVKATNKAAPATTSAPETNSMSKVIDKMEEQNQLIRSQLTMDRQILDKLDGANALNKTLVNYAR